MICKSLCSTFFLILNCPNIFVFTTVISLPPTSTSLVNTDAKYWFSTSPTSAAKHRFILERFYLLPWGSLPPLYSCRFQGGVCCRFQGEKEKATVGGRAGQEVEWTDQWEVEVVEWGVGKATADSKKQQQVRGSEPHGDQALPAGGGGLKKALLPGATMWGANTTISLNREVGDEGVAGEPCESRVWWESIASWRWISKYVRYIQNLL